MENTKYSSDSLGTYGYWLENPNGTRDDYGYGVYAYVRQVSSGGSSVGYAASFGVRPAITLLKSNISY
jgi:hypothetical protein